MKLEVITDRRWHHFRYRDEVPELVIKNQFDYLTEEDIDGFFCYRGEWYHISEFMKIPHGEFDDASSISWDGYHGDSFFSGTLLKVSYDGEKYIVGRYYS